MTECKTYINGTVEVLALKPWSIISKPVEKHLKGEIYKINQYIIHELEEEIPWVNSWN